MTRSVGSGAEPAGRPPLEVLEQRVRELQLLHEMGRRVASLLNVETLLQEMVGQLRRVLGVEIVSVMLVDDDGEHLRIAAASGLPADVVASARVRFGEGISGQVASRGEPRHVEDMSREDDVGRSPYHAQYTTESLICVPLKVGERVLGVINVNNKVSGEPLGEDDLALVTTFSAQAALALENSRLYGNLEAEVARVTAELQRSNLELRRLQEFSESILRHMSSGLVVCDLDGRIVKMNDSAGRLVGVDPQECLGTPLSRVFGEAGAREILGPAATPAKARRELALRAGDGREVLVGYSTSPLLDADREQVGEVVIFRDLTEVKRMEAELVRMDRLASLGVLGAGIAHEIRNPLAAIRFNIDFLREQGHAPPELDVIQNNVQRLDALVRKLLRFARPQVPTFEAQPLEARVEAVLALVAKQGAAAGVRIEAELDPARRPAWIDGPQVEQVVLNVVLNGIQSMPDGGVLRVSTHPRAAEDGPGHVEVHVADEGEGLDPERAEQVFDPFYTTRKEGTGLGLAVAHRIVQDHGGYIRVEPRPAGLAGTTFVIGFPLAPAEHGAVGAG